MWVKRTIIVPAALQAAAQNIGDCLTPAASSMFTTPLVAIGTTPITHYVSSGLIDSTFDAILSDAVLMYSQAQAGAAAQGIALTATQADCTNLVAQSVVVDASTEEPFATFARLGLEMQKGVL